MKPRVFVVQPIPEVALEILREVAEVTVYPHLDRQISVDELVLNAKRSDYIFAMGDTIIPAEVVHANPDLKGISLVSRKASNVDLEAALARRLPIAGNYPADAIYREICKVTCDLTMGMILGLAYRLVEADRYTKCGHFKQEQTMALMGLGCPGKTAGLIGLGIVGEFMVPRLRAFEMQVVYTKRQRLAPEREQRAGAGVGGRQGRDPAPQRFRGDCLRLQSDDAPADRRAGAGAHEVHGLPHQHGPRADRRRGRPREGPAGRDDRRGRS